MIEFCVIGSGISGATIANFLNKKHQVKIFDKARGPGGRSSFKRFENEIGYDHGMQYISPKSIKFKRFINELIKKRVLKVWRGKHLYFKDKKKEIKNHQKIIGLRGNNDISKHLIKDIESHFQSELKNIKRIKNYWELKFLDNSKIYCKNLILTCPYPQTKKLLRGYLNKSFFKNKVNMDANITAMFTLKKKQNKVCSYLFDDPVLGWASFENSKGRFKSKYNHWTLQSTYSWANKNINKNKDNKIKNAKILIKRFFELTKFEKELPKNILNHGWKYSSNSKPFLMKSYWDPKKRIGICGDWFVGPRLESGWISASDLFNKIKKSN